MITVTPGATATSGVGNAACTTGIAPIPGIISVSASNASPTSANVVVLGYGCIYQGGYLYSVDDTTVNTGSIGGTVVATADSATTSGLVWDSSSGCVSNNCYITNSYSDTNGTNLASPAPGGNTYLIYQILTMQDSELASTYAAGLCATSSMDGYNNWYLPAICEMGYGASYGGVNCGSQASPVAQNMQSNLVDNGNIGGLTAGGNSSTPGNYWSSTESSQYPSFSAWFEYFATGGGSSYQGHGNKDFLLGVRCARAL
ncbi:hypothetical protein [Legionella drancourtii]|uniref:DUF1566 domain-containing protein n=1 Tax=Legionella drancourtii LLAP12 TaxID=658187 RepID=G9EP26_9GAMM|nr:hypothetical protein [Legionella drancourtii]EHL30861.1 hypothetical protein LDG_7007 [Legionella drancourtii LLAP12]